MIGKWTVAETETLRAMLTEGKRYAEVAAALDRSDGSVQAKARALRINPMPKRARKTGSTLCWDCKNATNSGCYWSRYFRPVTGWTAKYSPLKVGECRVVDSYIVLDCPEFEEG